MKGKNFLTLRCRIIRITLWLIIFHIINPNAVFAEETFAASIQGYTGILVQDTLHTLTAPAQWDRLKKAGLNPQMILQGCICIKYNKRRYYNSYSETCSWPEQAHFPSDVVAGAVIGTVVGKTIVRYNKDLPNGVTLSPYGNGEEMGALIRIEF